MWKYLFKVAPSDIIKFDSTEFIVVPNDWATTTETDIQIIRDGGNSDTNENQIKTVYIEDGGSNYSNLTHAILGDGTGGEASVTTTNGVITDVTLTKGGKGYNYGIIDLYKLIRSKQYQLFHHLKVMDIMCIQNWELIKYYYMQDLMILQIFL